MNDYTLSINISQENLDNNLFLYNFKQDFRLYLKVSINWYDQAQTLLFP